MSTGTGFTEKFTFRGSPSGDQDFYMLAVLKKENINAFKTANDPAFEHLGTKQDKYFFLCHNQYLDTSESSHYPEYDRLYWSADPDDFQFNNLNGYLNQGVARMNASYITGSLRLRYRSSYSGSAINSEDETSYRNIGSEFNKINSGDQKESIPVTFIRKDTNNLPNYALKDNQLFYSVPYFIQNTESLYSTNAPDQFNSIDWSFRRYEETPATTSGTSGITVGILENNVNNYDKVFNFVELAGMATEAGTDNSYFNYGSAQYYVVNTTMGTSFYESATSFSVASNGDINAFTVPFGESVIKISSGEQSTVVNYTMRIDHGSSFLFRTRGDSSRGLTGSDFNIDINSGVSIYSNNRSDNNCFVTLTNSSTFSNWFDIYLLPVEEHAYFPKGFQTNDTTYFSNSCSVYDNGQNPITPSQGNPIYDLSFFTPKTNEPFQLEDIRNETVPDYNLYFTCEDPKGFNHYKDKSYRKIYNLLFFFLIGSLNSTYWKINNDTTPPSTSGTNRYPNIASEPVLSKDGSFSDKITFYGWDTYAESSAAYMFDYCRGNKVCGKCYGNNKDGGQTCFADSLTRRNAVLANTPSGKILPPLTGKERPTGTHSNPGNHLPTFVIVIISVLVVVFLITIIAVMYVKRKKWRENSV